MGTLGDLKAQQLVLLAVFVSFVTSIATGITTVSLMEQAPQPVQEVVNQIVERTIERVVPADTGDATKPAEKEVVTTVVKEEDLMVGSVEKNAASVVRITTDTDPTVFAGIGLVVGPKAIVTDGSQVVDGGIYRVVAPQGTFNAKVVAKDARFAVLVPVPANAPALVPAKVADAAGVKLAQSVIAVSGESQNQVGTGVVAGLQGGVTGSVATSVAGAEIVPGAILVNLRGDVVGLRVADGTPASTFAVAAAAKAFADSLGAPAPAPASAPAQ